MNELINAAKDQAAREMAFKDWNHAIGDNQFFGLPNKELEALTNRAMEIYAERRWIKTSDRLPNKGERVLCNTVYGIQIGWLNVNGDWKFTNGGMQFSVEHWMPSPELPNNNNTEPKTTKP